MTQKGHDPFAALSLNQIGGMYHVERAFCVHLSVIAEPHDLAFVLGWSYLEAAAAGCAGSLFSGILEVLDE